MRRSVIRFRLVAVSRAGRGAFAKFFQLGTEAGEFFIQSQHGLVLLRDVAFEPGQALLQVYPSKL